MNMTARVCFVAAVAAVVLGGIVAAAEFPYQGYRALVAQPENSWTWDSAIFGALQERGFEVDYGPVPDDAASLARYDLVALDIKRTLSPAAAGALEKYVAAGGAVYGSWGGPMGTPGFLSKVCKVAATRSVRIRRIDLLNSPLSKGIGEVALDMPEHVGHMSAGATGYEIVSVQPLEGGIPVARDDAGNVLGVLSTYGKGRTAVLGFGPEQEKYLVGRELGPVMLDNLLTWLLADRPADPDRGHTGQVTVALPARADVREVYLNGKLVDAPSVKQVGSLKQVSLPVAEIAAGQEAQVRITYAPLTKRRDVETMIHLPWGVLSAAAKSPARLADYLQSLGATIACPLLRGSYGEAWYKGMPQDRADAATVKDYKGNFLTDMIGECHKRNIRVIADIYFDNAEPVRSHPETARIGRDGKPVKDQWGRTEACLNNPLAQQHTLDTIKQLCDDYKVDGIILDDNFELDKSLCYCDYCKGEFRKYCERKGIAYDDPASAQGAVAEAWLEYRREATRDLVANVRAIAVSHGVPIGAWVGTEMDIAHLSGSLDFLGGMVYTEPPFAARAPLSVLGRCGFVCLLWAPDAVPQDMTAEVRQAVRSGCAVVGFWMRGQDGGYEMDPERAAAMRAGLTNAEADWLAYYRDSILSGDTRFTVTEGKLGPDEVTLTLKNTGANAPGRIQGALDLSALQPAP
jgi:hypothetical protein